MNKINRIIREEINRYILNEAIDFNNLKALSDQLYVEANTLRNVNTNAMQNNITNFLERFVTYCYQVTSAIKRCMYANSLNEAYWGGLSNYGINLPAELGGNLWQDAKRGYYGTKNWLRSGSYGYGGYNRGSKKSAANGTNLKGVNQNSVQAVKLYTLMRDLRKYYAEYTNQHRYNLDGYTNNQIAKMFTILNNISNEYNTQLRNAQGTNP